jgi:hypothetical protein
MGNFQDGVDKGKACGRYLVDTLSTTEFLGYGLIRLIEEGGNTST